MSVAIIGGTGNLGLGLALRFAHSGETVFIGSRSAERARAAAMEVNHRSHSERAIGLENAGAAERADVVIVAVPFSAQESTLLQIADSVRGKVVVDATVSLLGDDQIAPGPTGDDSAAERAQKLLPEARVVAALHTVSGVLLADLDRPIPCDVLIAGDDPEAKRQVADLISRLGTRALDAGPLVRSRILEQLTTLLIALNRRYRKRDVGIRFTGL